ncbi:hypothetical protein RhiirA4_487599 [Rhizophagus irregularis]|uniref:Uncharacterized protein n=1 Tax=Rhizophagus irregularis TaxID=588596 RepID=A0A2I1HSQ5_9GLOM|nr:hypothetical protein RhiirA4_487095 [Rhizophagus irregularis]PKY61934.1 hypothetical protein RhiirA4_487599 [Rhizophagus irregularis]
MKSQENIAKIIYENNEKSTAKDSEEKHCENNEKRKIKQNNKYYLTTNFAVLQPLGQKW